MPLAEYKLTTLVVVTTDLTIYRNIYISYGRTKSLKNKNCPTHSQKMFN
jgi:hypothetical protein